MKLMIAMPAIMAEYIAVFDALSLSARKSTPLQNSATLKKMEIE